ncbi:DUF1298 domain-containing protein [Rhodococcus spelaei]|uniref:DUF1298 domain-containing protein n=1 Tax=Rhodococcus spelaei TaxID=2546320 RepID=A0A541BNF9_9NOCA|nr:wax ester/triacylglycerol synthase domain-containing protein [Rhodococcus spelaei]TQF73867.1 DUF1298 domain-containing protein [Rhodococcus spelaei]
MSTPDAQSYWISRKIPTDQFLLYCFADPTDGLDEIRTALLERAALIPDLRIKVGEIPLRADYPYWVPMSVEDSHVRLHGSGPRSWESCLDAVAALLTARLDPSESPWRLHLFGPVDGAPRCDDGPAVVAVLQVAHALADGTRASQTARALFSEAAPAPAPERPWRPALALTAAAARLPVQVVEMVRRAGPAHRMHRQLERDTEAGLVPAKPPSLPKLSTNSRPNEYRSIRTVVVDADDLRGVGTSVTVGALTAISLALTRYLGLHGIPVEGLAAEVTVAKAGPALARNHFRNLAVDLFPDAEDPCERAAMIAESLRTRRLRGDHPAGPAEDRAMAAIPAVLLRRGVEQFDFTAVPDAVTGHTVVSSVARGAADLTLGGAQVRFTAGFPALSQFMGLTHGVHGIGDTVTLSIVTSPSVITDVGTYEQLLRDAVAEVREGSAVGRLAE